jgi:hypothetical protein
VKTVCPNGSTSIVEVWITPPADTVAGAPSTPVASPEVDRASGSEP